MSDDVGKLKRLCSAQRQVVSIAQSKLTALSVELSRNAEAMRSAERAAEESQWALMLPQLHLRHMQRLVEEKALLEKRIQEFQSICGRELEKEKILVRRLAQASADSERESDVEATLEFVERQAAAR